MRFPLAVLTGAALSLTLGVTAAATTPRTDPAPQVATAVAVERPLAEVAPSALPAPTASPLPSPTPAAAPSPAPTAAPVALTGRADLVAYRGLGTWLDAYDWAPEYGGVTPVNAVDAMADQGVRTLYLQAGARSTKADGLLSPDLLGQFLSRAHARGMRVQAWYLPRLDDPAADLRVIRQILDFRAGGRGFDTFGLDIEWRNSVADVAERNRRLVALSTTLRTMAPELPLAAIVVSPVLTEEVNRDFWRPFPWKQLAPLYDVWQPMGYWTDRKASSKWRDAYTSTLVNVRRLRRELGQPGAPVHPIGGIGAATAAEAEGFVRAAHEEKVLGGSLYDWPTTPVARYPVLRQVPTG